MTRETTRIRGLQVRAVRVPMAEPHRTAGGTVAESPLVLTDITTDDGIGHSVVFTYTPAALKPTAELIHNLESLIVGELLAPAEIEQKLARRFRLLGAQGLVPARGAPEVVVDVGPGRDPVPGDFPAKRPP